MKCFWRKDCEQITRVKKDLNDLNPTDLDFLEGIQLSINDSLGPYYRGLWNECKKLRINTKIFSFFTVHGTIWLKLEQDGPYNSITHLDDLKSLFLQKILKCLVYSISVLIYIYFCYSLAVFKSNLGPWSISG